MTGAIAPPLTVAASPPAPSWDFTGPSVGLAFGWLDPSTSGAATLDGNGALVGVRVACDYQFANGFAAGVGFQYDSTDVELGNSGVESDDVMRLGLRGGIASGRNWYYLTGGWASAGTNSALVGESTGTCVGLGYEVFPTEDVTAGDETL